MNTIIAATGIKPLAQPIYQQTSLPPFFDRLEMGPLPNSTLLKPMEKISNGFSMTQPLDRRRTNVRKWRKSSGPGFDEGLGINQDQVEGGRGRGREIVGLDGRVWNLPLGNSASWWGGADRSFDPPRDREEINRMAREFRERQLQAANDQGGGN